MSAAAPIRTTSSMMMQDTHSALAQNYGGHAATTSMFHSDPEPSTTARSCILAASQPVSPHLQPHNADSASFLLTDNMYQQRLVDAAEKSAIANETYAAAAIEANRLAIERAVVMREHNALLRTILTAINAGAPQIKTKAEAKAAAADPSPPAVETKKRKEAPAAAAADVEPPKAPKKVKTAPGATAPVATKPAAAAPAVKPAAAPPAPKQPKAPKEPKWVPPEEDDDDFDI